MALSEKHRSTLYNQLGDTVGDYEAVGELLSNIASRELDEPATRDFVAAQVQGVRTEIESLRTQISESEVRLTRYVHQELAGFRSEMAGFSGRSRSAPSWHRRSSQRHEQDQPVDDRAGHHAGARPDRLSVHRRLTRV